MVAPLLMRLRIRAALVAVACSSMALACQPRVTEPGDLEEGAVRLLPVIRSGIDDAALALEVVHVVLTRAGDGSVAAEATLPWTSGEVLAWVLGFESLPDLLDGEIEIRSGDEVMFTGSVTDLLVEKVSPASPGTVHEVDMTFVGPGHDAASVDIDPASPAVGFGETLQLGATVRDGDGVVIDHALVAWTSSASELAPVDQDGLFTAPDQRATVEVTATVVNGVNGTTTVEVLPAAAELVGVTGDGATAMVTDVVPISVRVLGGDGLPLAGVVVGFAAPSGASVADASVTSDQDGIAATEAVLGTVAGPYSFAASAAGVESLTLGIEAGPGPLASLSVDLPGQAVHPGEAVAPSVMVTTVDAYGNSVGVEAEVTLLLSPHPSGATLGGTLVRATADGVASFDDLVVDRHGAGFVLVATADGIPDGPSEPFDVVQVARSIEVAPALEELAALEATTSFTVVARDGVGAVIAGQQFTWSSDDETVATVGATGVVTARGNGSTEITVSADGISATATLTVSQVATGVAVAPAAPTLVALAETLALTHVVVDANGFAVPDQSVTWTSTAPLVATVDAAGAVTAASNGTASVTASVAGGPTGSAEVTVAQAVETVTVTPDAATLVALDEELMLSAEASDANGFTIPEATFAWSSDAAGVASIDVTGTVTAVANGEATVRATVDGVVGTASVTVSQVATTLDVDPAESTLDALGTELQLTATGFDANGHEVEGFEVGWSADGGGAASVHTTGLVTAEANGVATITASSDGLMADATVTVSQVPTDVEVDPVESTLVALTETLALTHVVVDANGFAVPDQTVTWTSSDPPVATVDATGTVTATANGATSVTATTAGGQSGSADVTVAQVVESIALSLECPDAGVPVGDCHPIAAFGDDLYVLAVAEDANGFLVEAPEIAWTSLDPLVATVDVDAVVSAAGNGTATIRASADGAVSEIDVTVRQVVVALGVEPPSLALSVGLVGQLTALPTDSNGFIVVDAVVVWTSVDELVATVDDAGNVTGVAPGATSVKAAADDLFVLVPVTVGPSDP